ncbi:phytoene/squalene synthase family protein [Methylocella tundrae]|uniref:Squalene/phytoene synthase n=1 Tax=Methylocella tundrae TaxID=227605 RepID=A0A4U8Z5M3_METTU|nr:phytoene/squalene synthase family protein [Methylocella tundrae]WPP04456.1 phytoene/squalene synthase family protein [Methylocella tundrae]VFU10837.1 Squalene/phytoene synthase [Methylocella tundrae]
MNGPAKNMSADPNYAYCDAIVRQGDPDRWLASLFIPEAKRRHVHALYAFNLEVSRIREIVSEPLLGEIRLQWWRDALEKPDSGDVRSSPVAAALLDTMERFGLPAGALLELIHAREFDLYDDGMESVEALTAYVKATSSTLFRMIPMILDGEQPASGLGVSQYGGIAYALTGLLRAFPWLSARGQMFIPLDILEKHGLDRADVAAGQTTPAILGALSDLRGLARDNLDVFLTRIECLPDVCRAGFLPISLCEAYLRQMEKPGYEPFQTVVQLPQWRRQWILWRAARQWA